MSIPSLSISPATQILTATTTSASDAKLVAEQKIKASATDAQVQTVEDPLADVPDTIIRFYEKEWTYKTVGEKTTLIKLIAERVANIFSAYLNSETHNVAWRKIAQGNIKTPAHFPARENVEQFKKSLISKICEEAEHGDISLSVKYNPEGMLQEVLNKSGIPDRACYYEMHKYMPAISNVDVFIYRIPNTVRLLIQSEQRNKLSSSVPYPG